MTPQVSMVVAPAEAQILPLVQAAFEPQRQT
jgi:hypothetical protein